MPQDIKELIERLEFLAVNDKTTPDQWFWGQKPDYQKMAANLREMYART